MLSPAIEPSCSFGHNKATFRSFRAPGSFRQPNWMSRRYAPPER
jgi:hypothetical protein